MITPPNTFIATQATAALLGAKIVFADINLQTGLIDLNSIKAKITNQTKAIVLVDYAGQPCDVEGVRELLDNKNVVIIQDAAHSLGSYLGKKPVGSMADITTFSFYATKNITTGEGGAISTNNKEMLQLAKEFGRQGIVRESGRLKYPLEGPWHQEVHEFGLNYRLTDFQCALGISQLKKLEAFKKKRQEVFDYYISKLSNIPQLEFVKINENVEVNWHLFPIFVDPNIKLELFKYLGSNNIEARVNYLPAYWHPVFERLGYKRGLCKNSEIFYKSELSLPMHTSLSEKELDYICLKLREFFETHQAKLNRKK